MENVLRIIREDRGLSIRALARLSTVAPTTICHIEDGNDPKLSTALKISYGLKVPLGQIWPQIGPWKPYPGIPSEASE